VDMVSSDDAWMFPIGGSVMLVGLYVLFKYLNKDYLNYLFTAYFGIIGVFAVSNVPLPSLPYRIPLCFGICCPRVVCGGLEDVR
jgi:hypothetical protein